MKRKYVYFSEIDRFGYTMQCVGFSEEEVREALIQDYINIFKNRNEGMDPSEAIAEYSDRTYMEIFLDELYVHKMEAGKPELN